MSDYRVSTLPGQILANLTRINPQPSSRGVRATTRSYALDGTIIDQGLYVEFTFNILGSASMYRNVLGQFNLVNFKQNWVTIYCRDDLFTYARYSGLAIRPESNWQRYFPRDIVILVRDLIAL